ncbi:MAG: hypothetical protein KatS3mg131_2492 [Candidatus Tectimicrobiota bacterium]|nr:MAG: hypothetical protein KatS3mg131_2492 [Candidatus Tectomicrobia bacterium]
MWGNRRKYARKATAFRVDFADARGRAGMGLAKNVSFGGMYLAYTPRLQPGESLVTSFLLPSGQPCKLVAHVVWADERGVGVRFLASARTRWRNESWEHLRHYCD